MEFDKLEYNKPSILRQSQTCWVYFMKRLKVKQAIFATNGANNKYEH